MRHLTLLMGRCEIWMDQEVKENRRAEKENKNKTGRR